MLFWHKRLMLIDHGAAMYFHHTGANYMERSRTRRFLGALISLETQRLMALFPTIDINAVRSHLDSIPLVCAGSVEAGPISQLSQSERFHWLVSPRSTIVQISPVHCGLCSDPATALEHLLKTMVLLP